MRVKKKKKGTCMEREKIKSLNGSLKGKKIYYCVLNMLVASAVTGSSSVTLPLEHKPVLGSTESLKKRFYGLLFILGRSEEITLKEILTGISAEEDLLLLLVGLAYLKIK